MKSKKPFPEALPVKKLLGPSFVILALGLGSGEVILWPYLASNYGLGIAWGAILGITCQFFINMEIERYALVKGESVFVGLAKIFRFAPQWFVFSTFIGFGLPGIVAASAHVFGAFVGLEDATKWIGIVMLLVIGIVLSTGKTVYGTMERVTKTIIMLGVPFIFVLAIILGAKADWVALAAGIIGNGEGYTFLPAGIALATFFGAFAYSGAAGNLNLTQSIYIKDKGYGMGKYAQKITSLFSSSKKSEQIELDGTDFPLTKNNIARFHDWWRAINIEHGIVFWGVGSCSMLLLMVLAYSTTYGAPGIEEGILFIIHQGATISTLLFPAVGSAFLFVVAIMLFQTQLGVMDSTSRIMAENVAIKHIQKTKQNSVKLSRIYAFFIWAQIGFGILLFLLDLYEPKTLIVLGAVINAFAMFVHIGMVSWLNYKALPKVLQPALWRRVVLGLIFLFFGFFSVLVIVDTILKMFF